MIYILIPKGMKYQQITESRLIKNNGYISDSPNASGVTSKLRMDTYDYLVDPDRIKPRINLQELIKEALQRNKGRKKEIRIGEITIYRNSPPITNEPFLEYVPNHNGKYATTEKVTLIEGYSSQKINPASQTSYGSFWFEHMNLSPEKRAELDAKRKETKENRQHVGDSPKAT